MDNEKPSCSKRTSLNIGTVDQKERKRKYKTWKHDPSAIVSMTINCYKKTILWYYTVDILLWKIGSNKDKRAVV